MVNMTDFPALFDEITRVVGAPPVVQESKWARKRKAKARRVFRRDGYKCRHCGSKEDLTIDHIKPRAKGGTDAYKNLQTLCRPCNRLKADSFGAHDEEALANAW